MLNQRRTRAVPVWCQCGTCAVAVQQQSSRDTTQHYRHNTDALSAKHVSFFRKGDKLGKSRSLHTRLNHQCCCRKSKAGSATKPRGILQDGRMLRAVAMASCYRRGNVTSLGSSVDAPWAQRRTAGKEGLRNTEFGCVPTDYKVRVRGPHGKPTVRRDGRLAHSNGRQSGIPQQHRAPSTG